MNDYDYSISLPERNAIDSSPDLYRRLKNIEVANLEEQGKGYDSWAGAVGESMVYETIVGDLARWTVGAWMENDPDFVVTKNMLNRIAPELEEYHEELLSAKGRSELDYRIMNIKEVNKHREALSQTSGGTAALIVGGALDPAFLTAGLLTGGSSFLGAGMKAGKGIKDISRMSRLQGAARGGLIAGVEVGALESVRAGLSDTWDLEDVPLAMAMSMGVGGVIGARWPQITVPKSVADETTERLYRQRFIALAEETNIPIEEAKDLALSYAKRAGRMGYDKLGRKKYHTDPNKIADSIAISSLNQEVAQGLVKKTALGERVIPEDSLKTMTQKQYEERVDSLISASQNLNKETEEILTENSNRVNKLRGDALRKEAESVGVSVKGPRGGKKNNPKIKQEIIAEQEKTIRAEAASKSAKLNDDLEKTKSDWASSDPSREAAVNVKDLTGEDIDELLKDIPTYDKHTDKRDIIQKAVDWVDSKAWLFGTTAGQLLSSTNAAVRRFATLAVDDPLMRNNYTVMRGAETAYKRRMISWRNGFYPLERRVAKELNIPMNPNSGWRGIVRVRIARGIRSDEGEPRGALGEAIKYVRQFLDEERKFGNSTGLWDLEDNRQYLPREFNRAFFKQLNLRDPEGLKRLVVGAIRSGTSKNLSDDAFDELASRIITAATTENYRSGRFANSNAWEALKDQLEKELVRTGLIDEVDFDDFLEVIAPVKNNKSIVRGGKSRLTIDENYIDPESGIMFSDLLNNDLDDLINRAVKSTRGAGYWRKMVDNLAETGMEGPSGYTLNDVLTWAKKQGPLSMSEEFAITQHYRSMLGVAQIQGGGGASGQAIRMGDRALRGGQDIAYFGSMASAGFANTAEMYNAVTINGFTAIETFFGGMIPSLRRAIEAKLTGAARFNNKELDLLEAVTTVGSMNYRGVLRNRMEDGMDFSGGGVHQQTSEALEAGFYGGTGDRLNPLNPLNKNKLANAYRKTMGTLRTATHMAPTGIGPVDTISRRAASTSSLQHFINTLYKIDKKGGIGVFREGHTNFAVERLKNLGLDDESITKIIAKLKQPGAIVVKRNYRFKKRYLVGDDTLLNNSPEMELLYFAIQRECDRLVQRPSVSTVPFFMNNVVGRTILQFRTFGISAIAQQAKYGLRVHDRAALLQFSGLAMMGILLTYAKAITKTIGWDEGRRSEYLDSALSPEKLAASTIQNHAMLQFGTPAYDFLGSILIPDYPTESLFGYSHRHNGLGAAFVEGIPLVDKLSTSYELLDNLLLDRLTGDYEGITQQHLQKLKSLGPLNNAFPIDNAANILIQNSGLPARK